MIANMSLANYSDGHPNSTGSIRTEFSVGQECIMNIESKRLRHEPDEVVAQDFMDFLQNAVI